MLWPIRGDSRYAGSAPASLSRPLACRLYYCDPAYQGKAEELSERFITRRYFA